MSELKPCPFCGGEAKTRGIGPNQVPYFGCGKCGCWFLAVGTWNSRPVEDALRADIEEARKVARDASCDSEYYRGEMDRFRIEAERLREEVTRLRDGLDDEKTAHTATMSLLARLRESWHHLPTCPVPILDMPCTCGLDAAKEGR